MASDPQLPGSSKGKIHSFGEKKKEKITFCNAQKRRTQLKRKKVKALISTHGGK